MDQTYGSSPIIDSLLRTLFEITCDIGIPWLIDEEIKKRTFRHYDQVVFDIDLTKRGDSGV